MKKIWVILFLLLALYLINVYSQSGVGIGLQIIDNTGPVINLIAPINNSGNLHENLTFSVNISDASTVSNCSMIINDKINLTRTSIIKDTQLNFQLNNAPIGSYNWSINCTDSLGFVGESPKRVVVAFLFTHFNGTNLSTVDIRNITNFVVETSGFGKINFSEDIDLSHGFNLNEHINISFNKIELDSVVLFTLNKSATLRLVGLTFTNPRILFDGNVCPDSICKKVSYSGGVLIFNVSHFTGYEAEETPGGGGDSGGGSTGGGGGGTAGGGGGGGGGGSPPATPIVTYFSIDKDSLKVVLKQGQTKVETLNIKNTGTTIFDVTALLHDIVQFKLSPESNEVSTRLNPNEEKSIELVFKALEDEKPDIYPKKISLKSPSVEKEILTIIEVDSAQPLFDVDVEVLPDSKSILPGKELLLEVNLFNVRGFGRVDVSVEYAIKDFQGNVVAAEHETLAVETQSKFARSLSVPTDLKPGNYVALVKVIYGDSIGTSSDIFEVKAKTIKLYPIQIKDYKAILLISAALTTAFILIFSAYRMGYLKKKAPKTKVDDVKQLQEEEKSQKLRKELEALESAHRAGFISEESYQRDKKRIEGKLNK